jgi:YhcH/YjgK/YiaL family protein
LQQADFLSLGPKKTPVVADESWASIAEYKTKDIIARAPESHQKMIDIHYLISGREKIGIAEESNDNKAQADYNEDEDYILYDSVVNEKFFILEAGEFMIIMPSDIHRPGCNDTQEEAIKKIVVKVAV